MKSEMIPAAPVPVVPVSYPYLGEYFGNSQTRFVVLFHSPRSGVVVATDGKYHHLGKYLDNWTEEYSFKKFEGSIVLSN